MMRANRITRDRITRARVKAGLALVGLGLMLGACATDGDGRRLPDAQLPRSPVENRVDDLKPEPPNQSDDTFPDDELLGGPE